LGNMEMENKMSKEEGWYENMHHQPKFIDPSPIRI
jgi:hypothetical protein